MAWWFVDSIAEAGASPQGEFDRDWCAPRGFMKEPVSAQNLRLLNRALFCYNKKRTRPCVSRLLWEWRKEYVT